MAKAKRKNRGQILDPDSYENIGMIESKIELDTLTLKAKRWRATFIIGTILPRSFHQYNMDLDLDEKPYTDRIEELKKDLDGSLFKEEKVSKKTLRTQVRAIEKELAEMRRTCERIQFAATVVEIKYRDGDTLVVMRIPDDVIEPMNRMKYKFEAYKIALIPILG